MTIPRATARLQFHAEFTLDDARRRVPYFAALGISHLYASPLTVARPGSTHGYDVTDHTTIHPELGGEAALVRLVKTLREHGMGLILDIVPNHMATHSSNAWWWDVWARGEQSPYAQWFDIDWHPADPVLNGKVLAPFLGDPYGQALAEGNIVLKHDPVSENYFIEAHGNPYPIAPGSLTAAGPGATAASGALPSIGLDTDTASDSPQDILARHDPGQPEGRATLHALLEKQNYRLAWWRTAPEEVNWRRFFEVSELVGVRIERPEVFDAVHALVLRLYEEGLIDGLRVDHVDGLALPIAYCAKLRAALAERTPRRPPQLRGQPAYLIIEKILAQGEVLDERWAVDGTTGYDFMSQVAALQNDPAAEAALTDYWIRASGDPRSTRKIILDARALMLTRHFPVEMRTAVRALHRVARYRWESRDCTEQAIDRVLRELLHRFAVYRTYADDQGRVGQDVERFADAAAAARVPIDRESDGDDAPLLDRLDAWLGGEMPDAFDPREAALRREAIRRFQQLTPPLAAKSLEDTTFYQYGRLLSCNDVGSEPEVFSLSVEAFMKQCQWRADHYPHAMLTTATHDHKRGEDVRARLAVLTELPDLWCQAAQQWSEQHLLAWQGVEQVWHVGRWPEYTPRTWRSALPHKRHRRIDLLTQTGTQGGEQPSGRDRYMLYQTIVGAWPADLSCDDADGVNAFTDRLVQWQLKSLREAKLHTSWIAPDDKYEAACEDFLRWLMQVGEGFTALRELARFARAIAPAGAINSLAQVVLKLTLPGVPDFYQGTDWWDFSLVDPDNRRPVDFDAREQAMKILLAGDQAACPASLIADWRDGRIKQAVIQRVLALRSQSPDTFEHGALLPLTTQGAKDGHLLAFGRIAATGSAYVLVPRLVSAGIAKNSADDAMPAIDPTFWGDTTVALPPALGGTTLREVVSGNDIHVPADGLLPIAAAMTDIPVCVLVPRAACS